MDEEYTVAGVDFAEADEDFEEGTVDVSDFKKIALHTSDWTVTSLLDLIKEKQINFAPSFQRRDAWTPKHKSQFIESLIIGIPVPQIVLAEHDDGYYFVIDGKQRLLALSHFFGIFEEYKKGFKLRTLEVLSELNGSNFDMLNSRPHENFIRQLKIRTIRCVVIKNYGKEALLRTVFLRLNTGSVKLSPQELRLALHPGWFSTYIDNTSQQSAAIKQLLGIDRPDFRMRDVELMARYLAFKNFMEDYSGNMQQFLDNTYKHFNEDPTNISTIESQLLDFELGTKQLIEVFGKNDIARRPNDGHKRPFNRAIFDVLIYYYSMPSVRDAAIGKSADIAKAFAELYNDNKDFVTAVEVTTKSLNAVSTRFNLFGYTLKEVLQIKIPIPTLSDSRIFINHE